MIAAKSISIMIIIMNYMLNFMQNIPTIRLYRFMLAIIIFMIVKAAFIGQVEVSPDMTMPREVWEAWVSAGMP